MKPIKITIIGCGAVVDRLYKRPLQKLERQGFLSVVALVDHNLERARKLQMVFSKASVYGNVAEAIHTSGSDLAIIASPAGLHAEHSISALENGNNVLCEKPMATSATQCNQMIDAARKAGLVLAIGMTRRFFPSFAQTKHMLSEGELGQVLAFSYREGAQYDWPVTTVASFQRSKGGGGILFDLGPHVLDTLIWLFGIPSIVCFYDDAMAGVEANCKIQLESVDWNGTVHLSWDHDLANELRIIGTKGEGIVPLDQIDEFLIKRSGTHHKIAPQIVFPRTASKLNSKMGTPKTYIDCIFFQLIQVIRAIQLGENPPVNGEQGKEVISLIEQCYKIAKPIDMPWLPPAQNKVYKKLHWKNHQ